MKNTVRDMDGIRITINLYDITRSSPLASRWADAEQKFYGEIIEWLDLSEINYSELGMYNNRHIKTLVLESEEDLVMLKMRFGKIYRRELNKIERMIFREEIYEEIENRLLKEKGDGRGSIK